MRYPFLALLVLAAAAGAHAADGPYAAAGYTYSSYQTRCDGDACDRRSSGFRAALGWDFLTNFSVEALYLQPGHFTASDVTAEGTAFHGRSKLTAYGATLGYAVPIGNFSIGAKAGMASVKADFTPGPAPAIAGGKTTAQFLGGLSATWHFTPTWSARLDWDYTRARMNRFSGDVDSGSVGIQFGF